MTALVFLTCLVNDPAVCRDHKIVLSAEVSALQCMNGAMLELVKWSEEHPDWRVVRWRCRPASEEDT